MNIRLVVMGTGPFAVPTFRALLDSPHEVLALVTRPDRPAHRREPTPINSMRDVAHERKLEVFEPESINSSEAQAWLRERAAELFVVCDYGQILSQPTLSVTRLGGINLHASLLPKYRGAAPINWAIYHGETETGVTVIHMTPQLDAGPCLVQRRVAIGQQETAPELETRLAALGAGAVLEAIGMVARSEKSGVAQDASLASKAPRLKKTDGRVDWSRSATAIGNQVRALQQWPKTFTFWRPADGEPLRLILEKVRAIDEAAALAEASTGAAAGQVIEADARGETLVVACGVGRLQIEAIQPAGKRAMSAGEFLRGHSLRAGDRLE